MAINDTKLKELQESYLSDRNPNTLYLLQQEMEAVSRPLVKLTVRRKGGWITQQRLEEVAYDSSIRIMELYLKDPNWRCTAWQSRLILEILYHLYSKAQKKIDQEISYDDAIQVEAAIPDEKESTNSVIEDMMEHPYWRNILLDCYTSRYYPGFIRKIAAYTTREWVEKHALRLHNLFDNTRK